MFSNSSDPRVSMSYPAHYNGLKGVMREAAVSTHKVTHVPRYFNVQILDEAG